MIPAAMRGFFLSSVFQIQYMISATCKKAVYLIRLFNNADSQLPEKFCEESRAAPVENRYV